MHPFCGIWNHIFSFPQENQWRQKQNFIALFTSSTLFVFEGYFVKILDKRPGKKKRMFHIKERSPVDISTKAITIHQDSYVYNGPSLQYNILNWTKMVRKESTVHHFIDRTGMNLITSQCQVAWDLAFEYKEDKSNFKSDSSLEIPLKSAGMLQNS